MRLAASVITRNERARYLEPFLDHLAEFVDEIAVVDDGSDDGTFDLLNQTDGVRVLRNGSPMFDEHEGRARQRLLDWTLKGSPSHVLALDADEFVSDGPKLRRILEKDERQRVLSTGQAAWSLQMEEVWELDGDCLCIRHDGGWRPYLAHIVWRVQGRELVIRDRPLASGRVPLAVEQIRAARTGLSVLHFGWANPDNRARRHARYMQLDGGKYHSKRHLDSIVKARPLLKGRPWPDELDGYRGAIERATGVGSARLTA